MTNRKTNCICSQLSDIGCRTVPFNIIKTGNFNIYSVIECINLSASQILRYGSEKMYVLKTYWEDLSIIDASGPINRCKGMEEIKYCPFCGKKFE